MNQNRAWKDLVVRNLCKLGLFELGRLMRRNKIPILCYHRFASTQWADGALSPELFDAHLRYLKKHFTPVSFRDVPSILSGRLCVKNPLILTVDDGYRDFVEAAVPLLRKHAIPATLFVTTRFIDGEIWLAPDIINYVIFRTSKMKADILGSRPEVPLQTLEDKRRACDKLLSFCKRLDEENKADVLSELADKLDVKVPPCPPSEFQPVSWKQLKELDGLIEIGSHTLTHPILSRVATDRAEIEIVESKKHIERNLDREVTAFAYPNGTHGDYAAREKEILRESGYRYAVTCNVGFNAFDADLLELNRVVVQHDFARFVKEVSGFGLLMGIPDRIIAHTVSDTPRRRQAHGVRSG